MVLEGIKMEWKLTLKIIAATVTLIGIIIGFLELRYAPHHLLLESSPKYPNWAKWLRWAITAIAPIVYIAVDFLDH